MFGREVNAINYSCLPTLDVQVVDSIEQHVFTCREILNSFNLVTADKTLEESFVVALVAVDDYLRGIEYLLKDRPH